MLLPILRGRMFPICYDFGSGGGSPKVSTVSDTYGDARSKFLNYIAGTPYPGSNGDMGQIGKPGPVYGGQTTAPMSAQETASLDKVNQYANQGSNPTLQAGQKQIQDTLGGQYDPATSPYYQAVKAQSAANLADTNKQIASDSAGGGRYFTGSRIKQQARAANQSGMNLDTILGTLSQNERQNQLSVLPQALAYGTQEQQQPLQQASALQSLGALPRTLQQNTDNASLENFYKSQYDYPLSILSLLAGVQAPPTQTVTPQNSGLQNATQGAMTAGTLALLMCHVAAEIFDGWQDIRTIRARFYIMFKAPGWFRNFYAKNSKKIAAFIHNKPILKNALRPIFEFFAKKGWDNV